VSNHHTPPAGDRPVRRVIDLTDTGPIGFGRDCTLCGFDAVHPDDPGTLCLWCAHPVRERQKE